MSRRIEGRGNIRRPDDNQEYINTKYLTHDRTIHSVHYYNRRKHELKAIPENGAGQAHSQRMQFKNQLSTLVNDKKNNQHHLKEVHVEPVSNNKKLMNFSEEDYALSVEDMVDVQDKQRMFPIQSYYTHIYQQQMKKQVNRFAHETQEKVVEAVNQKQFPQEESHFPNDPHNKPANSRFESQVRKASVNQLVPVHMDYSGKGYQPNLIFTVKQNQRLQISHRR